VHLVVLVVQLLDVTYITIYIIILR